MSETNLVNGMPILSSAGHEEPSKDVTDSLGFAVAPEAQPLFEPYKMGPFELSHRLVLAPLTRCRAFGTVPQPNAARYYAQRASPGGLMISEATCISQAGHGYPCTPGVYTAEQIAGWKPITQAVRDKGAVFFLQLWHVGRASHPEYQPEHQPPVSSSAVRISDAWDVYTPKGQPAKYPVPRPLEIPEIKAIVKEFAQGAKNALEAGFDGVEIHGANGYVIDQFLKDKVNMRTDEYGGSIENRCRFALEVVEAVVEAIGAERVGIRLSPFNEFLDCIDTHPYSTNIYLLEQLNKYNLAFIHMVEPRVPSNGDNVETQHSLTPFRKVWHGTFISAGGHTRQTGIECVRDGEADLVCYGRHFLANPDLPKRFALNAPLNKYDRNTFYTQGEEGYADYPFLEEVEATEAK